VGEANQMVYHQAPAHSMGLRLAKDVNAAENAENAIKTQLLEEYEQYVNLINEELIKTNSLLKPSEIASKSLVVEYLFNKHKTKGGDVMQSANYVMKSAPHVSILTRHKSDIWGKRDKTPGPAAYNPKSNNVKRSAPKFTMAQAQLKQNSTFSIGPFSAF
jgi:hypothetical protein